MQARKRDGYPWRYSAFLMSYYVANAVYQGYASKYFQARVTSVQLTVLMAAMPLISIFMQPVWGAAGDRMKSRNQVTRVMIALSGVCILLYKISDAFLWLLPISLLFAASYTAIQPMGDSIILEALSRERRPFGPLRLCGCLAFAVANPLMSRVMGERFDTVVYLTFGMLILVFASTYWLEATPGHQYHGEKMSLIDMLKLPNMALLLTLTMLLQLTIGYYYSFFSVHFTSLPGGSMGLLGICYFVSAVSEVPFLLNADRIFDKLGAGRLLLIAAASFTLRWTIIAVSTNVYAVLASQLLHGWGFIVITVGMSKYINNAVPDQLKASGQMLLAVVGFGIARVAGILGGGLLSEVMGGYQNVFYLTASIALASLLIFAPIFLKRKPLNGQ